MRPVWITALAVCGWLLISCCARNPALNHKPCPLSPQTCQAFRVGDFANLDSSSVVDAPDFEKRVLEQGGTVEFVFGDERPFRQCHASTVTQTRSGDLLAAWFGGTREKNPDVSIWLSRRTASGWTPPEKIARAKEMAHWNPVLFTDPATGDIHLFFKVGLDPKVWSTWRRIS
ncbi:MAG TPA: exo-alpha-sialidase, partial [Candidatus Hydrogenedentes bacterium]|nr:exo-alpha-sialidase [Candidatus Hydrogenedentota bacterium]